MIQSFQQFPSQISAFSIKLINSPSSISLVTLKQLLPKENASEYFLVSL